MSGGRERRQLAQLRRARRRLAARRRARTRLAEVVDGGSRVWQRARGHGRRPAWWALVIACALIALPAAAAASIARLAALAEHTGGTAARAGTASRHAHTSPCAGQAVREIRLRRLQKGMRARLSWSTPRAAHASSARLVYRVLRSGRTVGQTFSDSMVLAVTPGRRTAFMVQARYGTGARTCSARLVMLVPVRLPSQVKGIAVLKRTATGVVIGWRASRPGDAPIAGYRVELDGAVAGDTKGLRYALIFNSARSHRVRVAAVDTQGRLGGASGELDIAADQRAAAAGAAPSVPEGLSAEEVGESEATVTWVASRPGASRLAGYRVYREGQLVGETGDTSMRLTNLSSPHTYAIAVSAIDSDGAESARSAVLELTTTHTAPSAPSMLAAVHVSDTSATLSWQPGSAASGTVAGYLVFKDGAPVGVVQGTMVTLTLASERTYTFTVRTMDSAGYLSSPSPELAVVTTHTAPPAPAGVSVSSVSESAATVTWSPSTAVSGAIVGYRVFRNEVPVGQTSSTQLTLEHLAPESEYTITVSAVDSLGAISEPSSPLLVRTPEPKPTHGHVQAYVLASTDESFEDLVAHYQQVGVLYPTYYECGANGSVVGANDKFVTDWALARKVEVLPRINCLNVPYEEEVLNNPTVQHKLVESLAALCTADGYSGVQIDFENAQPNEREPFTSFITALAARLHAQGDKLSTVVTAKYWNVPTGRAAMYNDAALSVPSDYIFVLDWGIHWVTSAPGSIDEYGWFKRVAEYTATMPNLSKFTLGMPLYGVDWPDGGGPGHAGSALEYSVIMELAQQLGVTPEWEPTSESPHFTYTAEGDVPHQVWFVDQQSLAARAELATSLGMNVGLWRLGHEDQRIWELPELGGEG